MIHHTCSFTNKANKKKEKTKKIIIGKKKKHHVTNIKESAEKNEKYETTTKNTH